MFARESRRRSESNIEQVDEIIYTSVLDYTREKFRALDNIAHEKCV